MKVKRGKDTSVIDRGNLTDDGAERVKAEMLLSPEMMALDIAMSSIPGIEESKLWDDSSSHIIAELQTKSAAVNSGDLRHVESMLVNQAIALQHIFLRMTVRGIHQTKMEYIDGFMRLALKAQNQSRATLETLASMRTPPVVYAKQANINHGNQQVNNGVSITPSSDEIINSHNELLKETDYERMDTGATGATIVKNPAMATVD
jgi:hypothetical protein